MDPTMSPQSRLQAAGKPQAQTQNAMMLKMLSGVGPQSQQATSQINPAMLQQAMQQSAMMNQMPPAPGGMPPPSAGNRGPPPPDPASMAGGLGSAAGPAMPPPQPQGMAGAQPDPMMQALFSN